MELIGRTDEAETIWIRNREWAQLCGRQDLLGEALIRLGEMSRIRGRLEEALEIFELGRNAYNDISDTRNEGLALSFIGVIHAMKGDYDSALSLFQKHLEMAQKGNDLLMTANARNNIGNICYLRGDYEKALENYRINLELAESMGHKSLLARALGNMGLVLTEVGKVEEALVLYHRQLDISLVLGDKLAQNLAYGNLGEAHRLLGNYDEANKCFNKKLSLADYMGDLPEKSLALGNIGHIHLLENQFHSAIDYLDQAISLSRSINVLYYLCLFLQDKARALFELSMLDQAEAINLESLELARKMGRLSVAFSAEMLNALIVSRNNAAEGERLLCEMSQVYTDEVSRANINYRLWKITGGDIPRKTSLALCHQVLACGYDKTIDDMAKEMEGVFPV